MSLSTFTIYPRPFMKNLNTLRASGYTPGILYGQSMKSSLAIQIPTTKLLSLIGRIGELTTFTLDYEGVSYTCLLRDYQTNRLHTKVLHVDFQCVTPGEIIKLHVPLAYDGIEHLRGKKLVLEKALSKLPIIGPIDVLPEAFRYPVDNLERGAKIFAKDIKLPRETQLLLHPETIVATIQ